EVSRLPPWQCEDRRCKRDAGAPVRTTMKSDSQLSKAPSLPTSRDSAGALQKSSRREFLTQAVAAPVLIGAVSALAKEDPYKTAIASPDRRIKFQLVLNPVRLSYIVTFNDRKAVDWSRLAISIDGTDITNLVSFGKVERYRIRENYQTRGVHSTASNNCNGARIPIQHLKTGTAYALEIRVFNDGLAFRFVVPGAGKRVPDEATSFSFIDNSIVWFHDFEGHYEGIHQKKRINDFNDGEWAAPPLTVKLSLGGYAAITEAALMNYPGMGLRADGKMAFTTVLGHALPVSHPFDLRYGKEEAKRLAQPAAIEGPITTPWRVIMMGPDLNTLVNSDIISNLSPQSDKTLFPQDLKTEWVKPGRAVWRYLDGGENTLE